MTQVQTKEVLLAATFTHAGKEETRFYDFRAHEGRHAFLRFTSWALAQRIEIALKPVDAADLD